MIILHAHPLPPSTPSIPSTSPLESFSLSVNRSQTDWEYLAFPPFMFTRALVKMEYKVASVRKSKKR